MNYLVVTILVVALFTECIVSDETPQKGSEELRLFDSKESLKNYEDWHYLIENSRLIATGYVEDILYIVDEKKMFKKNPTQNGIVPLPNLKEGVKGILVKFRIEEVISTDKQRRISEPVNIYIHGGYSVSSDSKIPRFEKDKKYLVFLSPLEKADDVKNATVIQPLDLSKSSFNFDYKSAFKVTGESSGKFQLGESNNNIVNEVRQKIKTRQ